VAKSEYEVLASNGRLELDLLDRLEEKLGGKPSGPRVGSGSTVQTPKEPRKIRGGLFQAAANDEFEFLDGDNEWIHVGISGDSRGYLLRSSVDVPEKIAGVACNCERGRKIHWIPDGARRNEHVSGRLGGVAGENRKDLHAAAGIAESQGIWTGGAIELFAGAFSEGAEGSRGDESGAGRNRGDFRFGGRKDRGRHHGGVPANGEGRGFAGIVLDTELFGSGGSVSGDRASVTLAEKAFQHRGHSENVRFEEGTCRVENLSLCFR